MTANLQCNKQENPKSIASLKGESLENVKVYKYFEGDVKFDEPTTGTIELTLHADMKECKFYCHARNLTRISKLDSLFRGRILNSCQTWSNIKTQQHKMNSLYLSFIMKMVNTGEEMLIREVSSTQIMNNCESLGQLT